MRLRHSSLVAVVCAAVLLVGLGGTGQAAANLTITNQLAQPTGSVGQPYSLTLRAAGGTGALHWRLAYAALPPGLALNASSGVISGTPTTAGQYDFGVTVTDSSSPTARTAKAFLALMITPRIVPAVYVTQGGYSAVTSYALGANGNVDPLTDLTGSNTGFQGTGAIAIGPTGLVYVASQGNDQIDIFPYPAGGNTAPATALSGPATDIYEPSGLTLDSTGDLYVADYASNSVTAYPHGATGDTSPNVTITGSNTRLFGPSALTFDTHGDLWVANQAGSSLEEFAPGANGNASPIAVVSGPLTGLDGPASVTLDPAGNLLVASTYDNSILEFSPNSNGDAAPLRTISGAATGLAFPDGIDVDATGTIYVANQFAGVETFGPGANGDLAPATEIGGSNTGLAAPGQLAVTPPLSVRTTGLPAAVNGRRYHAQLQANLGTSPYRWRVSRGHLPPGLTLTPTGDLHGIPRGRGDRRLVIEVSDSSHPIAHATQTLHLDVREAHHR